MSELTTGKHGDRGRYVTTDNGAQIFLTKSGEIGQTGKSIDGSQGESGKQPQSQQSPQQSAPARPEPDKPQYDSPFVQSFAEAIIANIRKHEQGQQSAPAAPNPQDHEHHHSKLPGPLRQSLLNWSASLNQLTQPVGWAAQGARQTGNAATAKKAAFETIDKGELNKAMKQLEPLMNVAKQQGIDLRPFVKHNNLIPRELAAKLKPSDLFEPVRDDERYRADTHSLAEKFSAILTERYAAISQSTLRNLASQIEKPTEGQIESGNYRKGHIRVHGLDITIENAKGTRRRPEWPPIAAHYGYIKRTMGRDGDHVDVFIGPKLYSELVVVVDHVSQGGRFDEHKCLIGFTTTDEAVATYRKCYTPDWKVGPVTTMTIEQFKAWLKSGDQTKRLTDQVSKYSSNGDILRERYAAAFDESKHPRDESGKFTTIESHDTPMGKVEIRHRSSKARHPLEGMKDDPAFRNMPYWEHDFEVAVGGKTQERIRHGSDSDSMEIGIDDARFEANRIRKQAARMGQVVDQGSENVTVDGESETIPWKITHDGKGAFRATAGDWYDESGLTRKQAEKFIKQQIADHVKENTMQYSAQSHVDVIADRMIAAEMGITVEEYAARRAKNSPGQMSLFGDGMGGDTPLRTSARQQRFDWDESKVKRDPEGKFAEKESRSEKPEADNPKEETAEERRKRLREYWAQVARDQEAAKKAEDDKKDEEPVAEDESTAEPELPAEPELKDGEKPEPELPAEDEKSDDALDYDDAKTPRENAEARQKKLDEDYAFARASSIGNAGEDLKGSARHKRNEWRSLEDAENNGTAEELVTRDKLLKNEPHSLVVNIDRDPLSAIFLHQVMKSFPPKPGYGKRDDKDPAKTRAEYLEAYRSVKDKAESLLASGADIKECREKMYAHVNGIIEKLRSGSYLNRFNPTANGLIALYKNLSQYRGTIADKVNRAVSDFVKSAGEMSSDDLREKLADAAATFMEGGSIEAALGQSKSSSKGKSFNPAELYVGIAERKGGPKSKVTSAENATSWMVDSVGIRGVQFGNSVSDEERKHHATMAADALLDLADVTGLPIDSISLGGKLGLAIGARGVGNALAHYEPGTKVINLTRKKGVGSLAHEWAHAFDHELGGGEVGERSLMSRSDTSYFSEYGGESYGGKMVNGKWVREKKDDRQRPTFKSMQVLRESWNSSGYESRLRTELRERVNNKQISAKKASDYWMSRREMFARTFERYVQHKLESSGRKNSYLSGIETKSYKSGGLWPTDSEIEKMAPAFDALMDSHREENLGVKDRVKYSATDRADLVDMIADRMIADELGLTVDQYAARKKSQKGQQEFEWITVNADKGKGQPVMIDKKDGTIQAGMGGKFNGQKIGEIGKGGSGGAKKEASREKGETKKSNLSFERYNKETQKVETVQFNKGDFVDTSSGTGSGKSRGKLVGVQDGGKKVVVEHPKHGNWNDTYRMTYSPGEIYTQGTHLPVESPKKKEGVSAKKVIDAVNKKNEPEGGWSDDDRVPSSDKYGDRLEAMKERRDPDGISQQPIDKAMRGETPSPGSEERDAAIAKGLGIIDKTPHILTPAQAEGEAANVWHRLNSEERKHFSGYKQFASEVGKAFASRRRENGDKDPSPGSEPAPTPQPAPDKPAAQPVAAKKGYDELPFSVQEHVKRHVGVIKEANKQIELAKGLDKRFGGGGRYESEVREKFEGSMKTSMEKLREFMGMAEKNGFDGNAIIEGLGGSVESEKPAKATAKPAAAPQPATPAYEPPTIPGQQTSLFGGDDLNTGQKSLFNMARPSKADQRAAKRDNAPAAASLLEQIDDEQQKFADSRKSLPGQRDMFMAQFEAAMIEQYRVASPKKEKPPKPKAVIGNKGDRGRFITTEDGNVVFLEGKMQPDGLIDTSKAVARKKREKAKHTDPDKFVPVSDVEKAIVQAVGDRKKDVAYFKDYVDKAHKLVGERYREDADAMREVLAQFGYTGNKLSGFLSSLKRRRGDTSNIPGFDEMLDYTQKYHRRLLTARPGESVAAGDEESMLFERLKAGFPPPPSKDDPEVLDAAWGMSGIEATGLPSEWEEFRDADDEILHGEIDDDLEDAPFSASPLAETERYAFTFATAFIESYQAAKRDTGWRTTEDGNKIFIGKDGVARGGGPNGPVIGEKTFAKKTNATSNPLPNVSQSDKIKSGGDDQRSTDAKPKAEGEKMQSVKVESTNFSKAVKGLKDAGYKFDPASKTWSGTEQITNLINRGLVSVVEAKTTESEATQARIADTKAAVSSPGEIEGIKGKLQWKPRGDGKTAEILLKGVGELTAGRASAYCTIAINGNKWAMIYRPPAQGGGKFPPITKQGESETPEKSIGESLPDFVKLIEDHSKRAYNPKYINYIGATAVQ